MEDGKIVNLFDMVKTFELAFGWKISLTTFSVICINIGELDLGKAVKTWGCLKGSFPLTYLGMPLGNKPKSLVSGLLESFGGES